MSAPVTFIKKVAASDMQLVATWRRARDSNPRMSVDSLHDFQSCSFDQLGQLSIRKHRSVISGALLLYRTSVKKSGVNQIFFTLSSGNSCCQTRKGDCQDHSACSLFWAYFFFFICATFFIKTAREESTCSSLSSATIAKASCSVNTWKLVTIVRIGAV